MNSIDIPINDIDYESLFGGFDTLSNNTTSPTTENDTDSGVSDTPPAMNGLNNHFDIWPWNMDSPLSDDPNGEHYDLNALINDHNPLLLADGLTDSDNSTLDDLLAVFELPDQQNPETLHQTGLLSPTSIQNSYPSPPPSSSIVPSSPPITTQRPILLPRPSVNQINYPQQQQQQITNCVKLQSYAGATSSGPKCVKIEPVINTIPPQQSSANITIITTSKPITVSKVPVIKMPLTTNVTPITIVKTEADSIAPTNVKRITTVCPNNTNNDNQSLTNGTYLKTINGNNSMTSPPAKRRRSESSTNHQQLPIQSTELTTLTLDQLKVQYGNVSEEALKKHLRMIKNRESASLSRKRRKQLMENLEVKVKELADDNERLKSENTKLLARVHTLEMENDLLKTYKIGNGMASPRARKPLILMGIALLVVFNVFTLRSLSPMSNDPSNSIALYNRQSGYNNEGSIVRGRTILSARSSSSSNDDSYVANNDNYDGSGGSGNNDNSSFITTYPYLQCVAYINKTHSQRINRELHSWVQDHYRKDENTDNNKPVTILDSNSVSIPTNPDIVSVPVSTEQQHIPRKIAVLNRRTSKTHSTNKGQLQTYKGYEQNYDDFIHAIDRKNDTLYFVSFKRDHLILPATVTNQTQRPKMSLILPASLTHLNKSIHVPPNHVPMIQIDCEVEDTKLVFVKQGHIPSYYRRELFRYYSSVPQTTV